MWQFGVEGRRDGASLRAAAPQGLPGTKCISPRLRVGLLTAPCNQTHIVHPVICPPMLRRTVENIIFLLYFVLQEKSHFMSA